ncbi:FAD-binding oxidoreductase [Lapidilactobacillus achengensis]|uniref:FAD-binding oxidoreductase n=1 Tax=Lapidilactobacillus achengensis TaxID=2486000 RepID=A0ABW1UT09_9LACO|nr:FAD-linked oxidase C-terminal domain-containing protein [Lapidilactobacillus achengensis]
MVKFNAYTSEEIISDLRQHVTATAVHSDVTTLKAHENDQYGVQLASGLPLAYIEATSAADVQGVLQTARRFHIAIVPETTATSTVSGSDAIAGSFVLSLAKMNRIKEINPVDQIAIVEPGVINGDLDKAARAQGLFYAPDPGSKPISSIGGNVSTNAGGMSTVRYGATKDSVLGLTVILADGRELKLGGRSLKQAFGYDLTQLFVGSEGTLGIITEISVRLFPIPLGGAITGQAFFKDMGALADAVAKLRGSGAYPAMLEALDAPTVAALDRYEGTYYAENSGAMLILRLDSYNDLILATTKQILEENGAQNLALTTDATQAAQIMKLRRDMLPAVFANGQHVMEDMAVPLSKLAEMIDYIQQIATQLDLTIYTAGHAGDGNVHPTIVWPADEPEVPATVITALQLMFRKALALGGTISGEHAVGLLKNQWNNEELGPEVDLVQHQIKALFDPMNLLNPQRKIN